MNLRNLFIVFGLSFAIGCGSGTTQKPTFPVSGLVKAGGQPLDSAMITLYPLDSLENEWPEGFPRATTQSDGKFKVTTYADADGAPAGSYAVLIQQLVPCPPGEEPRDEAGDSEPGEKPLCDRFAGQYTKPKTSIWKVTVSKGAVEIPPIDIP